MTKMTTASAEQKSDGERATDVNRPVVGVEIYDRLLDAHFRSLADDQGKNVNSRNEGSMVWRATGQPHDGATAFRRYIPPSVSEREGFEAFELFWPDYSPFMFLPIDGTHRRETRIESNVVTEHGAWAPVEYDIPATGSVIKADLSPCVDLEGFDLGACFRLDLDGSLTKRIQIDAECKYGVNELSGEFTGLSEKGVIRGWGSIVCHPDRIVPLTLLVDGEVVAHFRAHDAHSQSGQKQFSFPLPYYLFEGNLRHLQIMHAGTNKLLKRANFFLLATSNTRIIISRVRRKGQILSFFAVNVSALTLEQQSNAFNRAGAAAVRAMLHSPSWRLTAPIRNLGLKLRGGVRPLRADDISEHNASTIQKNIKASFLWRLTAPLRMLQNSVRNSNARLNDIMPELKVVIENAGRDFVVDAQPVKDFDAFTFGADHFSIDLNDISPDSAVHFSGADKKKFVRISVDSLVKVAAAD